MALEPVPRLAYGNVVCKSWFDEERFGASVIVGQMVNVSEYCWLNLLLFVWLKLCG